MADNDVPNNLPFSLIEPFVCVQVLKVCTELDRIDVDRQSLLFASSNRKITIEERKRNLRLKSMRTSLIAMTTTVLLAFVFGVGVVEAQQAISPQQLLQGMQNNEYAAVVDVRTFNEWQNVGHIENATLVENLATSGTSPDPIFGCEECTLAVYCRSGARATGAIRRLQQEFGFTGTIYNAGGTNDWVGAGFPLVAGTATDSITPPCSDDMMMGTPALGPACRQSQTTPAPMTPIITVPPTLEPSSEPSTSAPEEDCLELFEECQTDADCCDGGICVQRFIGPPVVNVCSSRFVRSRAKTSVGSSNRGGEGGRAKNGS